MVDAVVRFDGNDRPYDQSTCSEFVLPYEVVRAAADPSRALGDFLQSTYDAAAICGSRDRAGLERASIDDELRTYLPLLLRLRRGLSRRLRGTRRGLT